MYTGMKVAGLGILVAIFFCLLGLVDGGVAQGQYPDCDDKCRQRKDFWNGTRYSK